MTPNLSANLEHERREGRREGEHRKRCKLTALEARREWFVLRGRRALLRCLLDVGVASMDDVRDVVTLPADIDPKLFGSVPSMLAIAGIIFADGFVKSSRPKAHARPLTVWRLVDREAAEQWLTEHIDNPDDADARPSEPSPSSPVSPAVECDLAEPATTQHGSPAVERDRPAAQQSLFDQRGEP